MVFLIIIIKGNFNMNKIKKNIELVVKRKVKKNIILENIHDEIIKETIETRKTIETTENTKIKNSLYKNIIIFINKNKIIIFFLIIIVIIISNYF